VLQVDECFHAFFFLDNPGQFVNALVDARKAHALSAIEGAVLGVKSHLNADGGRFWIIACVGGDMNGGALIGDAQLLQVFGSKPCGGHRHVKHFGDGGADGAGIGAHISPHHIVSGDMCLSTGGACEIIEPRFPSEGVGELDGVPCGINIFVRGLQEFVDPNTARLPYFESCFLGEGNFRAHTHREDDHVGFEGLSVFEVDFELVLGAGEVRDGLIEMEVNAFLEQVLGDMGGDGEVNGGEDLVFNFHNGDFGPCEVQVFCCFQADEACAHDDHFFDVVCFEIGFYFVRVLHIPEHKNAFQPNALEGGFEGIGAGGQQQLVIVFLIFFPLGSTEDKGFVGGVDVDDFGFNARIHIEAGAEQLRGLQKQLLSFGDDAADIIGKSAVGIGDVFASFQEEDLGKLIHPANSRSGSGPTGDASDNDVFCGFL